MRRSFLLVLGAAATLTACDGLKEAMTAHVDVVAKAGEQELSVERLATLLGNAPQAPIRKDVARTVADVWVNYQLVAHAGAQGDSLNDPKLVDAAMEPVIMRLRTQKWYEQAQKEFPAVDSAQFPADFAKGEVLAARHILWRTPDGATPAQIDEARRKAEQVRAQATSANFAALARQHSQDGSAQQGGDLGLFPKGAMVPQFEQALLALKPGEISPVIQTQFGFHVIRRSTWDEVKGQAAPVMAQRGQQMAESTYVAKLEQEAQVELKANAAATAKAVAANVDEHRSDRTTIATMKGGNFTAGDLAKLIAMVPQRAQLVQQIQQAPDSVLMQQFLKPVIRSEVVQRKVKSSNVQLDSTELQRIRLDFNTVVTAAWGGLRVAPAVLADSAKTVEERERLAASRVENYMDLLVKGAAPFVEVPAPLENALREKYGYKINDAGLDRVIERAQQIRASADSAAAANRPSSAVPMPGMPQQQGAPQAAPQDSQRPAPPAQKRP